MTEQTAMQPAPVDPANPLLAEMPSQLTTAIWQTQAGPRVALTIRTGSTTLTVFLAQADAANWAANLSKVAAQCSPLIVANGILRK